MLRKLGRLFTIKTRFEALLVTYAIAVGAVARGEAYLAQYPGWPGLLLFTCCIALPFLAGAKLLDAVRKPEPALQPATVITPRRRRTAMRHRRNRRTSDIRRTEFRRRA